MVNDKKIKETMQKLAMEANNYIIDVTLYNPTAYSDSIIEKVLSLAEELKQLYKTNK